MENTQKTPTQTRKDNSKIQSVKILMLHWSFVVPAVVFVFFKIMYLPLRINRIHECIDGALKCVPHPILFEFWAEAFVVVWVLIGVIVLLVRKSWARSFVMVLFLPVALVTGAVLEEMASLEVFVGPNCWDETNKDRPACIETRGSGSQIILYTIE